MDVEKGQFYVCGEEGQSKINKKATENTWIYEEACQVVSKFYFLRQAWMV